MGLNRKLPFLLMTTVLVLAVFAMVSYSDIEDIPSPEDCTYYTETYNTGISKSKWVKNTCSCAGTECSVGKYCVRKTMSSFSCMTAGQLEGHWLSTDPAPLTSHYTCKADLVITGLTPCICKEKGIGKEEICNPGKVCYTGIGCGPAKEEKKEEPPKPTGPECATDQIVTSKCLCKGKLSTTYCNPGQYCQSGIGCMSAPSPKEETEKKIPKGLVQEAEDANVPFGYSMCNDNSDCTRGRVCVTGNHQGQTYRSCQYPPCTVGQETNSRCLCDLDSKIYCKPMQTCTPMGTSEYRCKTRALADECQNNDDCGDHMDCMEESLYPWSEHETKRKVCRYPFCTTGSYNDKKCTCVGKTCQPGQFCGTNDMTNKFGCWDDKRVEGNCQVGKTATQKCYCNNPTNQKFCYEGEICTAQGCAKAGTPEAEEAVKEEKPVSEGQQCSDGKVEQRCICIWSEFEGEKMVLYCGKGSYCKSYGCTKDPDEPYTPGLSDHSKKEGMACRDTEECKNGLICTWRADDNGLNVKKTCTDPNKQKPGEKPVIKGDGKKSGSSGVITVKITPHKKPWVRMGSPHKIEAEKEYKIRFKGTNSECLKINGKVYDDDVITLPFKLNSGTQSFSIKSYPKKARGECDTSRLVASARVKFTTGLAKEEGKEDAKPGEEKIPEGEKIPQATEGDLHQCVAGCEKNCGTDDRCKIGCPVACMESSEKMQDFATDDEAFKYEYDMINSLFEETRINAVVADNDNKITAIEELTELKRKLEMLRARMSQ